MKPKQTAKQVFERYLRESSCEVFFDSDELGLAWVEIVFRGLSKSIPSMKGKKIPGKNFINPLYTARLKALDALYWANGPSPFLTFKDQPVHVVALFANRGRAFDEDNCLTTIRDWLEPNTKPVGIKKDKRGWGVGLVNNDNQISAWPLKEERVNKNTGETRILIRRWDSASRNVQAFVTTFFDRGSSMRMGSFLAGRSHATAQPFSLEVV